MATIADNRCSTQLVKSLRDAGMNSVRINSAHVEAKDIANMVNIIREAAHSLEILVDTKGPEIRTTPLADGLTHIHLNKGDKMAVKASADVLTTAEVVSIMAPNLEKYLKKGDTIMIDDGVIELIVESNNDGEVTAVVERGGELGSRKTVALPGVDIPPMPAVSARDKAAIQAAAACGVEMIAHSFVRSAADVAEVRALSGNMKVYSKIECQEALDNLEEIIEASDGILVARGDLGAEIAPETLPIVQHRIVSLCHSEGKPVIVATQVLDSMMTRPYPSRGEYSDIALAVMEGVSTLLLTGETAKGQYPVECVEVLRRTIDATVKYFSE